MLKRKGIRWLFVIAIGLSGYYFMLRDNSLFALAARSADDYRGQIEDGEKFGISVGDNIASVEKTLNQHNISYLAPPEKPELYPQRKPNECHGYSYDNIDEIRVYRDSTWRKGIFCVVVKDGIIVAFSWHFQPGIVI